MFLEWLLGLSNVHLQLKAQVHAIRDRQLRPIIGYPFDKLLQSVERFIPLA